MTPQLCRTLSACCVSQNLSVCHNGGMTPRPPAVAGGRPNRVTVRYSDDEIEQLDRARGSLSVADHVRRMSLLDTEHTHEWRRFSSLMDDCECGQTRPHQAGTR